MSAQDFTVGRGLLLLFEVLREYKIMVQCRRACSIERLVFLCYIFLAGGVGLLINFLFFLLFGIKLKVKNRKQQIFALNCTTVHINPIGHF